MNQLLVDELQLPAYEGLNAEAIAELLNAQSIEYLIEPSTPDVTNFLFNNGMYMKLLGVYRSHPVAEIRVAAEAALDLAQSQIPNINLQNPNTLAMIGALVTGQVWTQAEADSLLHFGKRYRSRAQELLERPVTLEEINAIFWKDTIAQWQERCDQKSQDLATDQAKLADMLSGTAFHEIT